MKKPCTILALLNQAVSRTKEHRGTNSPNVSPLKSSSIWCKVFNSSWKRSQQLPLTETFTAFSPTIMQKALCGICPHSLFYSSSEDLLGRQQWPRKSAGLPICSHPLLMGNVAGERMQLDRWEESVPHNPSHTHPEALQRCAKSLDLMPQPQWCWQGECPISSVAVATRGEWEW